MRLLFILCCLLLGNPRVEAFPTNPTTPKIAVSGNGDSVVTWSQFNGTNAVIKAAFLSFQGHTWSNPATLSLSGITARGDAINPFVGINTKGIGVLPDCFAVWQKYESPNAGFFQVEFATAQLGGIWDAPQRMFLIDGNVLYPQIRINNTESCAAIWQVWKNKTYSVQAATSFLSESMWTSPRSLSSGDPLLSSTAIAISNQNKAVAVWQETGASAGQSTIRFASTVYQGDWTDPVNVSDVGKRVTNPQVAINDSDFGIAVWQSPGNSSLIVQARVISPTLGGAIASPSGETDQNAVLPQISVSNSGKGFAIWQRSDGANRRIQSSRYSSGWDQTPTDLSTVGVDSSNAQIATNGSDQAIIVWQTTAPTADPSVKTYSIQARTLASDGTPGSISTLTTPFTASSDFSASPQVGIDDDGNGVAVWREYNGTDAVIRASLFILEQGWNVTPDTISN